MMVRRIKIGKRRDFYINCVFLCLWVELLALSWIAALWQI